MVIHGKTRRWYQKKKNAVRLCKKRRAFLHPWKYINPFYFRHERKTERVKLHRATRRNNKIRMQKGLEIIPEQRTNGWLTY